MDGVLANDSEFSGLLRQSSSLQQLHALSLAISLQEYLPASQAARVSAQLFDVPRREVYSALDDDKGDATGV